MGSSMWSDDSYKGRDAFRAVSGVKGFTTDYTKRVKESGALPQVHEKMNPKGVKIRESRDSAAHPTSLPIAVFFDVTGSMGDIPITLQAKLGKLMKVILGSKYVEHPQVFFGAVGDATCDYVPLQVGQFESGVEMDEDISRIFIERMGGGQNTESYELAAYFAQTRFATDAWEKRQKKGYIFFIGDERPYESVYARLVRSVIGDDLQADIPTTKVFEQLRERWNVFFLMPRSGAQHSGDLSIQTDWARYVGQNIIPLDDPDLICEAIALIVGLSEGTAKPGTSALDLVGSGLNAASAATVSRAVIRALNLEAD